MTAKTTKSKVSKGSTAKPAAKSSKAIKKPESKTAKSGSKPAAKVPVKSVKAGKPAVKPSSSVKTPKPAGKRVATKTSKLSAATKSPARKPVAKKPTVKPAAKKSTVRPAANKSAVKSPAHKPAAKAPVKKAPVKSPVKVPVKKPAVTGKGKAASSSEKQESPVPTSSKASMNRSPEVAPPKAPPKPGRMSRLAQLTVPSMAQSVASTAAKASYSQLPDKPEPIAPVYVAAKKDSKLANNWKHKAVEELRDAEVMAMPDSEYMNSVQTAYFRSKLVILKNDMLNNAGETTEHLREETVIVPDPADRATIEEEHALELRTRDRERKLLKKIAQAIVRIDAGDYGYCDETGEPIGVGRLLARPTATLSLEAQQRRELKQKMFGD